MGVTAVLTVRNEAAFLLDWIAHHRAIGITDFVVLSNDCDDGTDAMLDRLAAMGEIHHIPNPGPHEGGVQFQAMKLADKHPAVTGADWLIALDVDEYLNIHAGDHTLAALFAAAPEADAIALTWRVFGNCGLRDYVDAPVTAQFTRAAPRTLVWPWRIFMVKTLYRNSGAYKKLGVHRPRGPVAGKVEAMRWVDGAGRPLPARWQTQGIFADYRHDTTALAQVNHYPLGSMESYIVKRDRGRAVHDAHLLDLDYWTERNWCREEDLSIAEAAPLVAPQLARLRADPELARLHAEAVAWRKARFAALMADEEVRALYGRLLIAPPARPVSPAEAAVLYAHARPSGAT